MTVTPAKLRWRYFGGGPAVAVLVVGAIFGTICLVVAYFVRQTEEDYAKHGVVTTASVTSKDQRTEQRPPQQGGPQTIYTLRYRYTTEQGQTHNGSDTADVGLWNSAPKGQTVKVEYLRTQPASSRLAGRGPSGGWKYVIPFAVGSVAAVGVLVFGVFNWVWSGRMMRLVRDGEPHVGTVTKHDTQPARRGQESTVRLRYAFTDAAGTERAGKTHWLPTAAGDRWPVDGPLLVLQDPAHPDRFEADMFGARSDELARLQGG